MATCPGADHRRTAADAAEGQRAAVDGRAAV